MSIINKGIFDTDTVFIRQTGNDWPTAQVTTTADVVEATSNLYFTNARVLAAITSLTTANILETTNQYFTNVRVSQAVNPLLTTANVLETTNQYFTNVRAVSALVGANVIVNNLTVAGDFEVQGNVVQINTSVLNIEDLNIVLANGSQTSSVVDGAGIVIQGAQANIIYRNTGDKFVINKNTDFTGNVVATGDVRATGNLVANGLIIRSINVSDTVLSGNVVATTTTSNTLVAESITSNTWNGLYTSNVIETTNQYFTNVRVAQAVTPLLTTANVVETNTNLYYTNSRARSAFTAGRGIIITDDGILKSTIGAELFNTAINYAKDYTVTAVMETGLTLPSTPLNDRYILRSLHVTNISDSVAFVSSNVLYATGNTAYLGSLIPVPVGSIVEFMDRSQLLQPGDKVNLQGFNASQAATSGLLSSYFTYESVPSDATYVGTGQTLALSNTSIQIVHADQADTVIESLKVVNLKAYSIPVKVFFAYSNATPKAYMAYNMQVPPNTSIELLQAPKLVLQTDKIYASYANASDGDAISIFPSYRQGSVTNLGNATPSSSSGGNIDVSFYTTLVDGTTLYYTLE